VIIKKKKWQSSACKFLFTVLCEWSIYCPYMTKVKGRPTTRLWTHRGEVKVWLHPFSTSALKGGGVVSTTLRLLYPRYPLYRGLGRPQGRSERQEKSRLHQDSIPGPSNTCRGLYRLHNPCRLTWRLVHNNFSVYFTEQIKWRDFFTSCQIKGFAV
jgi:hypothetical protein